MKGFPAHMGQLKTDICSKANGRRTFHLLTAYNKMNHPQVYGGLLLTSKTFELMVLNKLLIVLVRFKEPRDQFPSSGLDNKTRTSLNNYTDSL